MSINSNYPLLTLTIRRTDDDYTPVFVENNTQTEAPDNNQPLNCNSLAVSSIQKNFVKNLTKELVQDIKNKIYNYTHTKDTSAITSSYGNGFDAIMKSLNIAPGGSITKSELIRRSRIDSNEDSNSDLCGALNRAFSYKKLNEEITYNDMMLFFMRAAGKDSVLSEEEYQIAVNKYSDVVQNQYDGLTTDQERLEFVIDKTEQYLKEAGLTLQQEALNRLKSANNVTEAGKTTTAEIGNITILEFKEEDGSIDENTGGAYSFYGYGKQETNDQVSAFWTGDKDNAENDKGIVLNSFHFEVYHWFDLVMIMVHELTHATAYKYYDNNGNYSRGFNTLTLEELVNKGFISSADLNNYKNFNIENNVIEPLNYVNTKNPDWTEDKKKEWAYAMLYTDGNNNDITYLDLTRKIDALWNEFAAYYMTNEYYDSIGADAIQCMNASRIVSSENGKYYRPYFGWNLLQDGSAAEYNAIKDHLYGTVSDYNIVPEVDKTTYDKFSSLFFNA